MRPRQGEMHSASPVAFIGSDKDVISEQISQNICRRRQNVRNGTNGAARCSSMFDKILAAAERVQ